MALSKIPHLAGKGYINHFLKAPEEGLLELVLHLDQLLQLANIFEDSGVAHDELSVVLDLLFLYHSYLFLFVVFL